MTVFKCKTCGSEVKIAEGATTTICENCGSEQTLPKVNDEKNNGLYGSLNTSNLVRKASIYLENKEWDKTIECCEKITDLDPENSSAYLYQLFAELKVSNEDEIKKNIEKMTPIDEATSYNKAIKFIDKSLVKRLAEYNCDIKKVKEGIVNLYQQATEEYHTLTNECKELCEKLFSVGTEMEITVNARAQLNNEADAILEEIPRVKNKLQFRIIWLVVLVILLAACIMSLIIGISTDNSFDIAEAAYLTPVTLILMGLCIFKLKKRISYLKEIKKDNEIKREAVRMASSQLKESAKEIANMFNLLDEKTKKQHEACDRAIEETSKVSFYEKPEFDNWQKFNIEDDYSEYDLPGLKDFALKFLPASYKA